MHWKIGSAQSALEAEASQILASLITLMAAGSEQELANVVRRLDQQTPARYGMEINAEQTKLMANKKMTITADIAVYGLELETVQQFKFLAAIISDA